MYENARARMSLILDKSGDDLLHKAQTYEKMKSMLPRKGTLQIEIVVSDEEANADNEPVF